MKKQEQRKKLIGILASNADDPQNTIDAIIDLFDNTKYEINEAKRMALNLYFAGKHGTEIVDVLLNEFDTISEDVDKIVSDAKEIYEEKSSKESSTHKVLTPGQIASYKQRLTEAAKESQEDAHMKFDDVLVDMLTELGYSEIVTQYNSTDKWFA